MFHIWCGFQDVSGCNTSPVEGADSGDGSLVYICSALSRDDGTFVFPSLASGEYTVVRALQQPGEVKVVVVLFDTIKVSLLRFIVKQMR